MASFSHFILGFVDFKYNTKARIFLSILLTTLVITTGISLFWFQKVIRSTTDTIVGNMEQNVGSRLAQVENAFEDVKRMHSTIIYATDSMDYLTRDTADAPTSRWFDDYSHLYNNLRTLGTTLSRIASGTGVYKADGSTCITGTVSLEGNFLQKPQANLVRAGGGSDVVFFLDKLRGEQENEMKKYIFVARSILDKGIEKSVIVSKLNETVFTGAFRDAVYPNGFILIADSSHDIIYDSSPGLHQEQKSVYQEQLQSGQRLSAPPDYTIFHRTSAPLGITVISSMSNRYIRESYQAVQTQLAILLVLSVIVSAIVSMLISDMITQRLQNLEKNMCRVGDGSLTQMIPVGGSDEIGRLSATFTRMIDQITDLMADIKEKEVQKRQMEIKVLRAQISPHFLYNSLNTINYLAMIQNARNITVLVSSLIDLLQGAVNIDDVLVPISDEIRYVKSYLNIQQYRFPEKIGVEYLLDDGTEALKVPKMILQPIVENALLHGFRDGQEDACLTIKVYTLEDEGLVISVTDNGVGISAKKISGILEQDAARDTRRFSGIGIYNVDTRIKLQFGKRYGLSIYSQEGLFTRVEVHLPAVTEDGGAAC